jgi:hypothetical protein
MHLQRENLESVEDEPRSRLNPTAMTDLRSQAHPILNGSTLSLLEYYRLPEQWVEFSHSDDSLSRPGFFRFGEGTTCFGTCSGISPEESVDESIPDAHPYASVSPTLVSMPFALDEVVRNLRYEIYTEEKRTHATRTFMLRAYYLIRPMLGVNVRKYLQRAYLAGWRNITFPRWPVDCSVERNMERVLALGIKASGVDSVPFVWFWPKGYQSCAVITHDVESKKGKNFCGTLMNLDESCGIKSAFQLVPEDRYEVSTGFLNEFRERGFELNVHDLNHDGMLFSSEAEFLRRVSAINQYGRNFGARGFRTAVMYRNQEWFEALDFEYDMSVPTVAHLEPQQGGCCTVMPFFIGKILELPLTTTQDYAMFHLIGDRSLDTWKREIRAIHDRNGLISLLVHPDYITESWARELYLRLLDYVCGLAVKERIWIATPGQVNDWWRVRSHLSLDRVGKTWRIIGEQSERAQIAYASLEGNEVRYSVVHPVAVV